MGLFEKARATQFARVLSSLNPISMRKASRTAYANCRKTQKTVLLEMVDAYRNTEFGREHDFASIKSIEDFRARVPLSSYDDYAPAIERLKAGEQDILFAGPTEYFYKSSGTTGPSKYIPEGSREALNRKVIQTLRILDWIFALGGTGVSLALDMALTIAATKLPFVSDKPRGKAIPFINRSIADTTEAGIPCGSASGRTAGNTVSPLMLTLYAAPAILADEYEGDDYKYMVMRSALTCKGLRAVIGNNALMFVDLIEYAQEHAEELIYDIRYGGVRHLEVSDEVREQLGVKLYPQTKRADELEALYKAGTFTPKYYWPKLCTASFWLGGSVGAFVDRLRPLVSDTIKFMDAGYGASEAKINMPIECDTPAGALATFTNFFEFMPAGGGELLLADELHDGEDYELIVTNNAGFYRYELHDLIHVDGFVGDTPQIYFLTKASDMANMAQEKAPGSLLLEGMVEALQEKGLELACGQVWPDADELHYILCMELAGERGDSQATDEEIATRADELFRKKIHSYNTWRKTVIHPPVIQWMRKGWRDHLLEKAAAGQASTAQVKLPVVAKQPPEDGWRA